MTTPLLFSPLVLRELTLKNRVVVAPMHQYAAQQGFATDWHLMNAGRFAAGGAGLVMLESTKVERRGCGTVGDLGLWRDDFVPKLSQIVHLLHHCGSAAGIHTMAVGLIVHAEQAENILREGRADLIALAREMLYNPNWAVDAAQKLGCDPQFDLLAPAYQYWLKRRASTVADLQPSTYRGPTV
ncbi:MAG: hypothetical protein EBU77_13735 [Betaproteobacteria bacterium]|nr:hypothetical protein [Betaproteobacteria bacterium]